MCSGGAPRDPTARGARMAWNVSRALLHHHTQEASARSSDAPRAHSKDPRLAQRLAGTYTYGRRFGRSQVAVTQLLGVRGARRAARSFPLCLWC